MKRLLSIIPLLLALSALAPVGAPALAADEAIMGPPADAPPGAADADALTEELSSKLRCPVCQGLSVNDSKAEAAVAMKGRIAELVAEGYSEDQIVDFFIDRYGEWVLLEPKTDGVNLLVWLGPLGFLLLGGGWVAWSLRGREEDPLTLPPEGGSGEPVEKDEYVQRILDELGEG